MAEMKFDTVIENGTAVDPQLGSREVTIAIRDGRIAALIEPGESADAEERIDAKGLAIFPGLIDPHMHIGFVGLPLTDVASETRSAAIGGVTSILNYVLKPDDYEEPFLEFVDYLERLAYVDMGIHFGIFSSEQIGAIPSYIAKYGVSSFKFFMTYKGDEGTRRGVGTTDDGLLFELLTQVAKHPGVVANVHAENVEMVWREEARVRELGLDGLAAHNAARPGITEAAAMVTAGFLARATGAPLYLVHTSSAEGADVVAGLRGDLDASPIYVETTPHNLSLTVDSPCGLLAKVNPPVRTQADVEALWSAVTHGVVDSVGTDHAPRLRSEKAGDVWEAGAAFPGVATMLSVLLTEGYHRRGVSLQRIAQISSSNTARIFNLPRKGTLAIGGDADLAIVDLDLERTVSADYLQSRADFSPWENERLKGWAVQTLVRGQTVMRDGEIVGQEGFGTYLRRPPAA
jgi:dihydropyrimidinase